MLISSAPVAIPVSTANPPTEAVASEAAQRTPIREPAPPTDSSATKNSTETSEQQPRNPAELNRDNSQRDSSGDAKQDNGEQNSQNRDNQSQSRNEQNSDSNNEQQEAQERREIEQLKRVDREVRAHETAHASAGGQLAGAPQLTFTIGPDGRRYAVGGEVSIDTSKVPGDPQATIDKMSQVRRAALAPANPSPQDLKVAALSSQIANQARVELNILRNEEASQAQASEEEGRENPNLNIRSSVQFTNPVAAKRSSLLLNQKIVDSGALDDINEEPLLSQTA
ncbi:putative metalloprotease CJM1_0395 family protein [Aliikangiella coralliicola]|uniref:Catalase n=1 Tax=Aliikangiella coralliicola TaxID=2592383 RepID=A0A545UJV1_9GAMM|nr:putative metalloprotease CJM1_0395 family protein [Aliikangiella coralliicola]TQV89723.1 catalase [Aliikangiella coralliicola]